MKVIHAYFSAFVIQYTTRNICRPFCKRIIVYNEPSLPYQLERLGKFLNILFPYSVKMTELIFFVNSASLIIFKRTVVVLVLVLSHSVMSDSVQPYRL